MTKQKDLKARIHERMKKTNESYATARMHVLAAAGAPTPPPTPVAVAPSVSDDEEDEHDVLWDEDAKGAVRIALDGAEWDYAAGVLRIPYENRRGDLDHHEIDSADELRRYLNEVAFEGYNESAPRDDGEWVFPFEDEDYVEEVLENFEERLSKFPWWN